MKKLTKEEAEAIVTRAPGNSTYLRSVLLGMKSGEYLHVEPKDWKWKSKTPHYLCRRLEQQYSTVKFDCKVALDGSGWIIKREK